ncbi:MAG TPA: type IX secretion system sortase PorU [Chryseosolibacter sp.]|nr:type IX secretion system sortase PorU [Chryseosolibacter sp.]
MNPKIVIRLFVFLSLIGQVSRGQSVLSTGSWYKLGVKEEGVYKINIDLLKKLGINPSTIDPKKIRMFGNMGGMLPQSNSDARPSDLQEIAIVVSGEQDGRFDKGDYILFFASGPTRATFDPVRNIFRIQNNLYSDENFYFLTVSSQDGKRASVAESLSQPGQSVTEFNDFIYHELDQHNELHSGREWYGEKFGLQSEFTFKFSMPGIVPGSEIRFVSDVMAQSYANAAFKVLFNNNQVIEHIMLPIPSARYTIKGYERRDTVTFTETAVAASAVGEQQITYQFQKASGFSQGYLDFFLACFRRSLKRYGDQTIFTSASSQQSSIATFSVEDMSDQDLIWDVTDPYNVMVQQSTHNSGTATFTRTTETLRKFVAFSPSPEAPRFVGKVPNQDLHSLATPQLAIVSHPALMREATRLADHRRSTGWTVEVVSTEQIYNEFSSGRQDVTAIRDFLKLLYDRSPSTLKAALLFGKCSYDYKDRVADNTNFVPTYESRNSLHPLQTYSSDDYFAFLENTEGEWQESPAKKHTLDIGVGRLPVTTLLQAQAVVDKIISYDRDPELRGYWRKKIAFVADDGNGDDGFTSLHQFQADALARDIEEFNPAFDTRKLYMGRFPKVLNPGGETVPQMTNEILTAFEDGSLIINYTGHGSEQLWADERVFSNLIIDKLENRLYPFLVTATCEFGRHDDPFQTSSAELTITRAGSGAIGLVTTARPVNSTTNFELNRAFYEALFQRTGNGYNNIGEVFRQTKNNSVVGVANRNFSLLADPSMTLALPPDSVQVTSVRTTTGSDTLKALSTVIIQGEIQGASGEKLSGFKGVAEVVLYNKETQFVTIGRNNPPFQFKEWTNILFRGQASVDSGEFTVTFMMPKNISYSFTNGKLSLYASSGTSDANGVSTAFKIGGTEPTPPQDGTPPEIRLFIGDTTFQAGGVTDPDTYLVARLSDSSGLNISSYGIGNSMIASLDEENETFILNDYYIADLDNFRKGTVRYPLRGLAPGRHTLTLTAWDVHNNAGSATIEFTVTSDNNLTIETLGNYPNPFSEQTKIFFTHNRSGDDLEAQLFIYTAAGKLVESIHVPIAESGYLVELAEFDNRGNSGKKLPPGLYFARVMVRSLTNGSKNERITKLIILN